MGEVIIEIVKSPNLPIILLALVPIIAIAVYLVKKGYVTINTKNVTITPADRERAIIRQQTEWIKLHLEGMEASMNKPPKYDKWRGKYVAEVVYDEYVNWITYNHLETTSSYIEIKQDRIVSVVQKLTEMEYFRSEEFIDYLRKDTKESITKLVQIREVYK